MHPPVGRAITTDGANMNGRRFCKVEDTFDEIVPSAIVNPQTTEFFLNLLDGHFTATRTNIGSR
ncbi:hypothetical protein [Pseudomonas sp. TSRC2-2]|uniref:hypothetical protein n=1 Tax=unclassified Pseudomonas TaxID=196821 RepID=UPI003CF837F9